VSRVVLLGTVLVILVPYFLPAMHERYFFLADVLSVVAAFYVPRRLWPVPLLVQFASAFSYVPFLAGRRGVEAIPVDFWILALAMLLALALVLREFFVRSQVQLNPSQHEEQRRPARQLQEQAGGYQAER